MKAQSILPGCLLLVSSGCLMIGGNNQPDPKETVARAIAASGGRERLRTLERCEMETRGVLFRDGKSGTFTVTAWQDLPDRMKQEMRLDLGGEHVSVVTVVNGQSAWEQTNGKTVALPPEQARALHSLMSLSRVKYLYPLLDPQFTLTPLKESRVNGRPALGVRVTSPGQPDIALYFDKESSLLVKCAYREVEPAKQGLLREEYYEHYEDLKGLPWPMKKTTFVGGRKQVEREAVDFQPFPSIDPAVFARP